MHLIIFGDLHAVLGKGLKLRVQGPLRLNREKGERLTGHHRRWRTDDLSRKHRKSSRVNRRILRSSRIDAAPLTRVPVPFQRHQELLRKQKALQEQYARLQQLQRGASALAIPPQDLLLKKTGSESNLLAKMGLGQSLTAAAPISGSLTHLAPQNQAPLAPLTTLTTPIPTTSTSSTTKVYETDIL